MLSDLRLIGFSAVITMGLSAAAAQAAPTPPPLPPPPVPPVVIVPVPPAPPVPPARPVRSMPGSAVPLFDLAYLITAKDYPPEARRKRREGVVEFAAVVSAEGRVWNCLVTQSSAHASLKQATCDLITQRARFGPAINAEGKAILGLYRGQITWDLSKSLDTPLPGTITRQFEVDAEGKVSRCRITKVTGPAARQYKVGAEPCRYTEFFRDYEAELPRKRKIVTEVETVMVSEVPPQP